jgi:HEAT repeat protein
MLRVASKISPQWAATLLKDIDDPDVKVAAEAAMALQYMGMSPGLTEVVTAKKDTNMTMMSMDQ